MLSETGLIGGKPVLHNIIPRSDGVVLRRRHQWIHNSFQTVAFVKLQPGGHGTEVHVTLRSNYLVAAFITFWLGLVVFFNLFVLIASLGGRAHFEDLGFTVAFLVFGFGFIAFGRLLARPESPALLEFIRQTTGAQDTDPRLNPTR
jgi:hypothetical protein